MKYLYNDRYSIDSSETVTYITIDPAGGTTPANAGPRTDKWGFCVNAVSMDNKWFILDMFAEHLDEAMFMTKLWELDALWHPYRIGIEKTQHLEAYVRLEFARKNRSLPIVQLSPKGRRKERRIMALSSMFPNMYFSSRIAGAIQHSMRRWYTEQEHGDDELDALAYQIDIAVAPTEAILIENKALQEQEDTRQALLRLPPNQRAEWEVWIKKEKELTHGVPINEEFMRMYDY
jgi:hypothetical protein